MSLNCVVKGETMGCINLLDRANCATLAHHAAEHRFHVKSITRASCLFGQCDAVLVSEQLLRGVKGVIA
jgi:hypothetical protein